MSLYAAVTVAAAACAAPAPRQAVSRNYLPGRIRIRRLARAALTVKQRGAAVGALKTQKHGRGRKRLYTSEHEHMRARTHTPVRAQAR